MAQLFNIGRASDNQIVVSNEHISSHHAQLIVDEEGNVFINDLNSSNGTFVNGQRINGPTALGRGDSVVLGSMAFNWETHIPPGVKVPVAKENKSSSRAMTYMISIGVSLLLLFSAYALNEMHSSPAKKTSENKTKTDDKKDSNATDTGTTNVHHRKSTLPGDTTRHQGNAPTGQTNTNNNSGSTTTPNSTANTPPAPTAAKEITYDFSCIWSDADRNANQQADRLDDWRSDAIDATGVTVSVEEEMEFGDANHESLLQGATVLENESSAKLQRILNSLVARIPNPRGFTYKIFLIESDVLNAWTCGARIYVTTEMLNFTKSDNELACIIGHEIFHNELGHINKMLKAQKAAEQTFGPEFGSMAATIDAMMRSPFGKKDEAACDFHGSDLCIAAGYDACEVVGLWDRMAADEGEYNSIDNFTRSHPYSEKRRDCIANHLKVNYGLNCTY